LLLQFSQWWRIVICGTDMRFWDIMHDLCCMHVYKWDLCKQLLRN
jgi:hypothetical protein